MVATDYVICALATLMGNEPKEDALMGMTLCGLIVRNRQVAGWDGGNWLTIIDKHDLYSANSIYPGVARRVLTFGDPQRDSLFRRCLGVAENIFSGREKDISEGGLWYGRLDNCSEDFKERIVQPKNPVTGLQEHPMVAKVGAQMCFK